MKILLHICCAPCTIYPLKVLRGEGHDVKGFLLQPEYPSLHGVPPTAGYGFGLRHRCSPARYHRR